MDATASTRNNTMKMQPTATATFTYDKTKYTVLRIGNNNIQMAHTRTHWHKRSVCVLVEVSNPIFQCFIKLIKKDLYERTCGYVYDIKAIFSSVCKVTTKHTPLDEKNPQ